MYVTLFRWKETEEETERFEKADRAEMGEWVASAEKVHFPWLDIGFFMPSPIFAHGRLF